MPRKRVRVEIGVTAGILAGVMGCASAPEENLWSWSTLSGEAAVPEGLAYPEAVQCGALLWIMADKDGWTVPLGSKEETTEFGVFKAWAEVLAASSGHAPSEAMRDIAASRHNLLSGEDESSSEALKLRVEQANKLEIEACRTFAKKAVVDHYLWKGV